MNQETANYIMQRMSDQESRGAIRAVKPHS